MEIENWRFINTGFNNPCMNMAIDEALVQLMRPGDLPILRFFDWSEPCMSIGYSQRIDPVRSRPAEDTATTALGRSASNGVERGILPTVRRPTGGGTVLHGDDVTYSVVLPRRFDPDIKKTYSLIQSWIRNGLDKLGLKTTQYGEIQRGIAKYCFKSPSFGDIMIGDTKIGGLAGRRIRQRILCQGYVDLSGYGLTKEGIRKAIIDNWCGELIKDCLNEKEEELAGRLCEDKYSRGGDDGSVKES